MGEDLRRHCDEARKADAAIHPRNASRRGEWIASLRSQ